MSTAVMAACWPLQMPPTPKAVLVSLADNANDHGHCYPSIATVCERTCLSERAVQNAVSWLEQHGALRRDMKTGRSTVYTLTPGSYTPPQHLHPRTTCTPAPRAPTPAADAPPPPQHVHPTPAPRAPRTVIEPSVEPSRNRKRTPAAAPVPCPVDVPEPLWADWQRVRRAKRGGDVTETALDGMRREAGKAGLTLADAIRECVERSWVALKADWLQPRANAPPRRAALDRQAEVLAQMTGGFMGRKPTDPRTIDVEPDEQHRDRPRIAVRCD